MDHGVAGLVEREQSIGRPEPGGQPGAEGDQPDGGQGRAGEDLADDLPARRAPRQVAGVVRHERGQPEVEARRGG